MVSQVGGQMQVVAINWHVYLLTHSALALGFVGLTRVVPIIAFSLLGGVVADRRDTALLVFPTKALAHDQLRALRSWLVPGMRAVTFDGDTYIDYRARRPLLTFTRDRWVNG